MAKSKRSKRKYLDATKSDPPTNQIPEQPARKCQPSLTVDDAVNEKWSKSKKKRMRLSRVRQDGAETNTTAAGESVKEEVTTSLAPSTEKKTQTTKSTRADRSSGSTVPDRTKIPHATASSSLQKSFQDRLSGSRFRVLNEELYTSTSATAFERFQQNPSLFDEYHSGFRHQVEQWPVNPVSILVERLTDASMSSQKRANVVVADFGCGDAELAKQLLAIRDTSTKRCPFVVHSFDLVARGPNAELITASDVAHTPLDKESVDVGIFCLSLMGTNLSDFIREAHRVLKPNGVLHIAEVRSRFENLGKREKHAKGKDTSNDSDDLQGFLKVLNELGFRTCETDRSNTMFVLLELKKNGKVPKKDLAFTAKPCIYKRR